MHLALIGGEEFADGFESVHQSLIAGIAGGKSRGVFLPTCAADDGLETVRYWCGLAQKRLLPYSASVDAPLIIDHERANDPANAQLLRDADWIYLGGGYPHVGMRILHGTRVLAELIDAVQRGTLILGASAGAMMLCARSVVISEEFLAGHGPAQPVQCLGLVPNSLCAPHFNHGYARRMADLRPAGFTMIGIDEQTALVQHEDSWHVLGKGRVVLERDSGAAQTFTAGQNVPRVKPEPPAPYA